MSTIHKTFIYDLSKFQDIISGKEEDTVDSGLSACDYPLFGLTMALLESPSY
jgi:hypothetical protein